MVSTLERPGRQLHQQNLSRLESGEARSIARRKGTHWSLGVFTVCCVECTMSCLIVTAGACVLALREASIEASRKGGSALPKG